jgi:uncharacterized coiled-coil protein SlyX
MISSELTLTQSKTTISRFVIAVALMSFGLLPRAQAVVPAPDGGYPGGNTAEGQNALFSLTSGGYNTGVGYLSLRSNTIGSFNTATGAGALFLNTADQNTATGVGALLSNSSGFQNTANGAFALVNNLASRNTAVGFDALYSLTTGSNNVAVGVGAGSLQTAGTHNVYIGHDVGGAPGESNTCYISGIFGNTVPFGGPVFVGNNNQLGTMTSSKRFKQDIKPMDQASDTLFALEPVIFRYKKDVDSGGKAQFGLVAEDVEKVNPDLIVRDKEGKPYTVRYDAVNAMLLNEFLKEHRKVQEGGRKVQEHERAITQLKATTAKQEATIAQLESTVTQQQKAMEAVTARLEKQASQIQKVSDQLKASKFAPRTAGEVAVADQRRK